MRMKLTKEFKQQLLDEISEGGRLGVCIERTGDDSFRVTGVHNGKTILEWPADVTMRVGDTITLQGVFIELNVD